MSQLTDIAGTASPHKQPDVPRPEVATSGSTAIHSSSTPSATQENQVRNNQIPDTQVPDNHVPDFFQPGHLVRLPLHTAQDVTRARNWIQLLKYQTRPVLSDLEFSFRGLYDVGGDITSIRVTRFTHAHKPHADPETELAACLRLHSRDSRIPARALNMYNEATKDGGVWIARHWTNESRNLQDDGYLGYIWLWYYDFFKNVALRKEGKDWDGADLESVVEFLADLRRRR